MGAEQEQDDRHAQQEFLGRRVLVAVVNLLPHVEIVVGTGVEFKGHATHPVEHEVRSEHIADVGQGPGRLLRYPGNDIIEDFERGDYYDVDGPGAYE